MLTASLRGTSLAECLEENLTKFIISVLVPECLPAASKKSDKTDHNASS